MRHRVYFFIWLLIAAGTLIGWATFGGEGWLAIALIGTNGSLLVLISILLIMAYSDAIVSDQLKSSTDGKSFANCRGLGEHTLEIAWAQPDPQDATGKKFIRMTRKVTVYAFPPVRFFEANTGEWGVAKKLGGGYAGFIIVAEHLIMDMSPIGNIAMIGKTVTYKPHKLSLLQLLRRVKPTEQDKRKFLPQEWWDILAKHDRFNPQISPIHVILDPAVPIITRDRLKKTYLVLPGVDTETRRILPSPILLEDIAPGSNIIDMRPEMQAINLETANAAREWAGKEANKQAGYVQYLEQKLAHATSIEELQQTKRSFEQVYEVVGAQDDGGVRRGGGV